MSWSRSTRDAVGEPGPRAVDLGSLGARRPSGDNIRARVLNVAVEAANKDLAKRKLPPLAEKLTPHSLRRTFCSLLYALGEDPGVVMDEMGTPTPGLALRVYRQAMRRGEKQKAALRALVEGVEQGADSTRDVVPDRPNFVKW
jgi:integrase